MKLSLPTLVRVHRRSATALVDASAAVLLAWAVAAPGIRDSILHYRLAMPAGYDDVSYFLAAQLWLNHLPSAGLFGGIAGLIDQHAPFSTALAAAGFATLGPHDWAPYVANGIALGFCFFAVLRLLDADGAPLPSALLIALALATMPFFTLMVVEFRPDLFDGFLVGMVVALLFRKPVFLASLKQQALLGLLIGAAVTVKPSEFPATGVTIAAACLISMAAFIWGRKLRARDCLVPALRAIGVLWLGALVLLGPYLVAQGGEIFAYINDSLFGRLGSLWAGVQSPFQQVTFYVYMLELALGPWFAIALATIAFRLFLAFRLKQDRAVTCGAYAMLIVIYAVLGATIQRTYFLGAMFYGTVIMLMVRDWAWLLKRAAATSYAAHGALAAMAAIAIAIDAYSHLVPDYPTYYIAKVNETTGAVWSAAQDVARRQAEITVVADFSDPVRLMALQLEAERTGLHVNADAAYLVASVDEFMMHAANADIVVLSDAGRSATGVNMAPVADRLMQTHHFALLQTLDASNPPFSGPTRIYGRVNPN